MTSAYTTEQIDRYLEHISLPSQYRLNANPARDLKLLSMLHTYQISAIPYENLSLHYSQNHKISLDPQILLEKFMRNGRGGHCMEVGIFFGHVLRGLGFYAYPAGARNRLRIDGKPQGEYQGWRHIVNIVTLNDGAKYMVDVGFGGDGPTMPLALTAGYTAQNIGTQEVRLRYDSVPGVVQKDQKLWIYEYRNGNDLPWNEFYCFPELEFLPLDFQIMNYFISYSPDSLQSYTPLVVKFLRRENEIYGKVMLVNGLVKQNHGGKTFLSETCATEGERVEALRSYFDIVLTDEEKRGIRGRRAELPRK